jgi:hypothetical protein
MNKSKKVIEELTAFKAKEKFKEEQGLFYPGMREEDFRCKSAGKINYAADDFMEVAADSNPTDLKYQFKIKIGLQRFEDVFDTEDKERICSYYEELMDIVGLESSGGLLNDFLYGFDPTTIKEHLI